ncbi:MAG: penicillin-binding protein 2 [Rhodospirillales bacterium]|nr:penicillin-binding protein 2 [Alphaproteobacteria bacterium]USO04534.1 MAG: penicillin-binding protein 2 [Rhodospirillales bacterium]
MNLPFRKTLQMTGSRRSVLDQARGRIVLVSAFFVFAYIMIAARAFDLSIIQGQAYRNLQFSSFENRPPEKRKQRRADIVDRNGVLLARSLKTVSLYADPALVSDPAALSKELAEIFPDLSYGSLLQKLQSNKRFVWIKRNMTPESHYRVLYLGNPGLGFREEDKRVYPQGDLAAHLVGFSNVDGKGLAGIERSFDNLLRDNGAPLALSLDVRLQHVLRRELLDAVQKHHAKGGAGIIMDVRSGEVLASVSLPDFDPHKAGEAEGENTFNRATLGVYEPGSTFKIFSTAALLETTNASLEQSFDASSPIKIGRFRIRDYHAQNRALSVLEVFMYSSNIGSALMGEKIGTERFKKFLSDLGLMNAPEMEISEVGKPLVPSPWREVNTLTASFGHGIAVSPLQLVGAASSIVNGGILVRPTFVLSKTSRPGRKKDKNASDVRIVSPQTAHRMRQLLRLVVTDGTGKKADVPGYEVGGKTGTAEKNVNGRYDRNSLISSFFAVFPVSAPRYSIYLMVDEPKGIPETYGYATGGWVAAPPMRRVIESVVSVLGIAPEEGGEDLAAPLRRYVKSKKEIEKERKLASH